MTHGHGHGGELTPVEDHLAEILATVRPLAPTELSLGDVHGLVLAEDVSTAGGPSSRKRSAAIQPSRSIFRISHCVAASAAR